MSKRIPWTILKQEFIFSPVFSVKEFLEQKQILQVGQKMPGGYIQKTKGWLEEKQKFWQDKLDNLELEDETKAKLAQAVLQAVDTFASMFLHYNKKIKEKIKNEREIKLQEIIQLGQFIEKYHQLDLNNQNEHTVNIKLSGEEKEIFDKILQIKK